MRLNHGCILAQSSTVSIIGCGHQLDLVSKSLKRTMPNEARVHAVCDSCILIRHVYEVYLFHIKSISLQTNVAGNNRGLAIP